LIAIMLLRTVCSTGMLLASICVLARAQFEDEEAWSRSEGDKSRISLAETELGSVREAVPRMEKQRTRPGPVRELLASILVIASVSSASEAVDVST
jgi:hypothetical protein